MVHLVVPSFFVTGHKGLAHGDSLGCTTPSSCQLSKVIFNSSFCLGVRGLVRCFTGTVPGMVLITKSSTQSVLPNLLVSVVNIPLYLSTNLDTWSVISGSPCSHSRSLIRSLSTISCPIGDRGTPGGTTGGRVFSLSVPCPSPPPPPAQEAGGDRTSCH